MLISKLYQIAFFALFLGLTIVPAKAQILLETRNEMVRTTKYVVVPFDTGNHQKGLVILDVKTGAQVSKIGPLIGAGYLYGISVSDQSNRVVASMSDYSIDDDFGNMVQCYDILTGKLLWKKPRQGDRYFLISPSGKYAAFSNEDNVMIYDGATGKPIVHKVKEPVVSKDGDAEKADEDSVVLLKTGPFRAGFDANDNYVMIVMLDPFTQSLMVYSPEQQEIVSEQSIPSDAGIRLTFIGYSDKYIFSSDPKGTIFCCAFSRYDEAAKKPIGGMELVFDVSGKILRMEKTPTLPARIQALDENRVLSCHGIGNGEGVILRLFDKRTKKSIKVGENKPFSQFQNAFLKDDALYFQVDMKWEIQKGFNPRSMRVNIKEAEAAAMNNTVSTAVSVSEFPVFQSPTKRLRVKPEEK